MANEYCNHDESEVTFSEHYIKHVFALTAEKLHSKADIAQELAWRDMQIERLRAELVEAKKKADRWDTLHRPDSRPVAVTDTVWIEPRKAG